MNFTTVIVKVTNVSGAIINELEDALEMILRSVSRSFWSFEMGPIKQTIRRFRPPAALAIKQMPPRPTINEEDIEESFLKGSGPGGQKIVCIC